jgi:hypothetical protein
MERSMRPPSSSLQSPPRESAVLSNEAKQLAEGGMGQGPGIPGACRLPSEHADDHAFAAGDCPRFPGDREMKVSEGREGEQEPLTRRPSVRSPCQAAPVPQPA